MTFLGPSGDNPAWYLAISRTLLFALAALALAGAFSRRLDRRLSGRLWTAAFLALALLALVGARWPTFVANRALDPDEAQALAQAITALHDPIPWKSFDGNTCGPLNTYVLMLPALFGLRLSYVTTHVITVLLEFGAVAALYGAAATLFEGWLARLAILPPVALFALVTRPEFVHYASEHLPIFLATAALWCICVAAVKRYAPAWLFAAGVLLGMAPFAKLQSAPLVAATFAAALCLIFGSAALDAHGKAARAFALAAGALAFPAALLAVVAANGVLYDFWISYVQSSLAYILWAYQPPSYLLAMTEFGLQFDLLLAVAAAGAIALALLRGRVDRTARNAYLVSLVLLGAGVYAIFAPKRESLHYVLFGLMPVATSAAVALGIFAGALRSTAASGIWRSLLASGFVAGSLFVQGAFTFGWYPYLDDVREYKNRRPEPVVVMIRQHLSEGDRLAIWGYRPEYFVESYTLLGTRDAIGAYQWVEYLNPYLAYYRARYIRDFIALRPRGFLDAGSESFDDPPWQGGNGLETFPELAALVRRDYRLVASYRTTRFYVRRDAQETASARR